MTQKFGIDFLLPKFDGVPQRDLGDILDAINTAITSLSQVGPGQCVPYIVAEDITERTLKPARNILLKYFPLGRYSR